jgi:hypothetical protein
MTDKKQRKSRSKQAKAERADADRQAEEAAASLAMPAPSPLVVPVADLTPTPVSRAAKGAKAAKPRARTRPATGASTAGASTSDASTADGIDTPYAPTVDASTAARRETVVEAPAVVERTAPKRVGLFVGREWSFPPALIEEVRERDVNVVVEYAKIGAPAADAPCPYDLLIDRISHEVPVYRSYLKQAVVTGTRVVNNPFMWTADDKFFGAALAGRLGVASPRTVVLPNKAYVPGIVPNESLRNLEYPLDWQGVVDYIGLPCVLKDAHGGGWKEVYVCRSLEELLHHYDRSGLLTMIVQEFIEWDQFVRCLVIGQQDVLPMKYDPGERRYLVEHEHLSPELGARVVRDSLALVRALGYDMNSIEFAVRDGVPYAIDFMNPAPDMDIYSLTPHYFEWAVQSMADMAISLAKNPRRQVQDLRWDALFTHSRETADDGSAGSASAGLASTAATGEMLGSDGFTGAGASTQSSVDFGAGDTGLFASATAGPGSTPSSDQGGPQGSGSGGRSLATTAEEGGQVGSGGRTLATSAEDGGQVGSGSGGRTAGGAPASAKGGQVGSSGRADAQPISRGTPGIYVDESPFPDVQPPPAQAPAAGRGEPGGTPGMYTDEMPGQQAPAPGTGYSARSESDEVPGSPGVLSGDVVQVPTHEDKPSSGDASPGAAEEQS